MEIVILIIVLIVCYFILHQNRNKEIDKKFISTMISNKYFKPTHYQIMTRKTSAIGLDSYKRMICVVDKHFTPYYLQKNNIHKVEILIDKDTYHSRSFLTTWGTYFLLRTIADKSIAETGARNTKEKVLEKSYDIQLKISTTDFTKPNHTLKFLVRGNSKQKNKIMQEVYDWSTRIETL
jgi:hypothetical protein